MKALSTIAVFIAAVLFTPSASAVDLGLLAHRPKVREQLAQVPHLDERLASLEKSLDTAKDQSSLTATTARYILELTKEANATPEAFDFRMPSDSPSVAASLSKTYADYVSPMVFRMDFTAELTRAEALAADARAGRDPLAAITGDVHLAYRSELDRMLMPYRIFVPQNYEKSKQYPLIVLLHAAACDENTLMMPNFFQALAADRGYLLASINGRGPYSDFREESGARQDLFDVIALMQKHYNIDSNHIFLTGASMGGFGTWTIGLEYRDRFAALASMAGTATRTMDYLKGKLDSGKKIPVLITVGGKDKSVPPEPALEVYKAVKKAGYPSKMIVYPEDTHYDVFQSSVPEVFSWFDTYRK